ncbi:hypothetical protein GF380_02950 [Candidatus Uhrbacteria bacterium]|nr:hypothetical protein [Candidatus Uhrbacteria bacterium]MBD3284107.1 hypothetical protein [Candidatus Uhrbacteria bacterium]
MSSLALSLIAGFLIAIIATIGYVSLFIAEKRLATIILIIVPFAAGSLLAAAFVDLIPEAFAQAGECAPLLILIGIGAFYLLDHLLLVYHSHAGHRLPQHGHDSKCCPAKPLGVLNLAADTLHNITDGIIIASAFLVNPGLGISASIAVALHEIPQEIGDFGILLWSGYNKLKALWLNLLVAFSILIGIAMVFLLSDMIDGFTMYTVPIAAGGFIYMALANLLPEMREEHDTKKRFLQVGIVVLGIAVQFGIHAGLESLGIYHAHGHEHDEEHAVLHVDEDREHGRMILDDHEHEESDHHEGEDNFEQR